MDPLSSSNTTITYVVIGAIVTAFLAAVIHFLLGSKESKSKSTVAAQAPVALKATEFQPFKVSKKEYISHNTLRITFDLQSPDRRLGLPIGHHVTFRYEDENGKGVQRSYTPVTGDEILGSVTFVIKVYRGGVHPKFPDGGKMSQHVDSLKVGDIMMMKGPKGHLRYLGEGRFTVKELRKPIVERKAKAFGLIAGGTGITPMLQIINAVLRDEKDKTTTLSLLYANQTEDDILVRDELEQLAKSHPDRFKVSYTLDTASDGWKGFTGFIDKAMLEKTMPAVSSDGSSQILMCGPPPMLKFACYPNLEALGFKETDHFTL